jgi:glucose/arabinose dehydrogenase
VGAAALIAGALAGWLASVPFGSEAAPAVLAGLTAPRGLSPLPNGDLLIAEGGAGRLLRWDLDDPPAVLSADFPFLERSGIEGESASGLSSALEVDGVYYAVVGEANVKGHQELYRLVDGGTPEPVTGQDILGVFPPNLLTNPYDLVALAGGAFLVSDAGRNELLLVSAEGDVSTYVEFPDRTVAAAGGDVTLDVVPTGLAWGPDGALYMASLTGFPYPTGAALVYRIDVAAAEAAVFADGFTAATDLAFEDDGSLLVTEFSTAMAELVADLTAERARELPGRLVRLRTDGTLETLADDLVGPTSVAVVDGRIFVSEEFAGRVREIGPGVGESIGGVGWLVSVAVGLAMSAASFALWWVLTRRRTGRLEG